MHVSWSTTAGEPVVVKVTADRLTFHSRVATVTFWISKSCCTCWIFLTFTDDHISHKISSPLSTSLKSMEERFFGTYRQFSEAFNIDPEKSGPINVEWRYISTNHFNSAERFDRGICFKNNETFAKELLTVGAPSSGTSPHSPSSFPIPTSSQSTLLSVPTKPLLDGRLFPIHPSNQLDTGEEHRILQPVLLFNLYSKPSSF